MNQLRAFVAIEISQDIQQAIQARTHDFQQSNSQSVRWVPAENIHLTLKFLGDISSSQLDIIKRTLIGEAGRHGAFELSIGRLGAYPTPRRPRVIWVGVDAPAALKTLQHNIDNALERLSFEKENKPFSPHLTLGRVNQHASMQDLQRISTALEKTSLPVLGTMHVTHITVFKSDLRPSGAVYTSLFNIPLAT